MVAACDTFRAAAVEQLTIWSERIGCEIVKNQQGSDPASVAHDACEKAKARGFDVLIVDTAGRLHTQTHLMRELEKIRRVVSKQIDGAPHEVLLVLDATTRPERHHPGGDVQEDGRNAPASSWPSSTARPRAAPSSPSSRSSACRSSSSASARSSTTWNRSTPKPTSKRCSCEGGRSQVPTRVFNTETVSQSATWTGSTVPLPLPPEGGGPGRFLRAVRNAYPALRAASDDDIVVFTDENPVSANLFGLLQRRRRSRPTLVRTDPLLSRPRSALRKRYLQAVLAAVDGLIVWAPAEIDRYHQCLGIPRNKMTAVRFHHTLHGTQAVATPGDFLFSGGNSMRDYPTLIEAVRACRSRFASRRTGVLLIPCQRRPM